MANFGQYVLRNLRISFWKVDGASFNLKGITLNWYCSPSAVEKAIYFRKGQ